MIVQRHSRDLELTLSDPKVLHHSRKRRQMPNFDRYRIRYANLLLASTTALLLCSLHCVKQAFQGIPASVVFLCTTLVILDKGT